MDTIPIWFVSLFGVSIATSVYFGFQAWDNHKKIRARELDSRFDSVFREIEYIRNDTAQSVSRLSRDLDDSLREIHTKIDSVREDAHEELVDESMDIRRQISDEVSRLWENSDATHRYIDESLKDMKYAGLIGGDGSSSDPEDIDL